jgi:hypothetical protein
MDQLVLPDLLVLLVLVQLDHKDLADSKEQVDLQDHRAQQVLLVLDLLVQVVQLVL